MAVSPVDTEKRIYKKKPTIRTQVNNEKNFDEESL